MTDIRITTRPLAVLLVLIALTTVGCQRTVAERNALYDQNTAAQAEINRLRMANDTLAANYAAAQGKISQLQAEVDRLRAGQGTDEPSVNKGNTGFEDIKDVESERTGNIVTVRVASDILFSSGKIALKSTAKSTLNQVAGVLSGQYSGKTIRVEGYTDTDPIRKSKWKDNLELSLQRAASVHRYLQTRGVDAGRMYAAGFGPEKPLATKAKSRRVEIVVVLSE